MKRSIQVFPRMRSGRPNPCTEFHNINPLLWNSCSAHNLRPFVLIIQLITSRYPCSDLRLLSTSKGSLSRCNDIATSQEGFSLSLETILFFGSRCFDNLVNNTLTQGWRYLTMTLITFQRNKRFKTLQLKALIIGVRFTCNLSITRGFQNRPPQRFVLHKGRLKGVRDGVLPSTSSISLHWTRPGEKGYSIVRASNSGNPRSLD